MVKKILLLFGTRPEAIKMIPVYNELLLHKQEVETRICITAQHRAMLDQVLSFFNVEVDYDLNLMKPNQNLYDLSATIIAGLKPILEDFKPDYVLVHGDTTTTMAGSVAAAYSGAIVGHVEAGLRTYNKKSPFPEELNRLITSAICDIHFAPTHLSKSNLLKENIEEANIVVTGNTVIDALQTSVQLVRNDSRIENYFKALNIDFSKMQINYEQEPEDEQLAQANHKRTTNSQVERISRNAECPCGSSKKFKHCHGIVNGIISRNSLQ